MDRPRISAGVAKGRLKAWSQRAARGGGDGRECEARPLERDVQLPEPPPFLPSNGFHHFGEVGRRLMQRVATARGVAAEDNAAHGLPEVGDSGETNNIHHQSVNPYIEWHSTLRQFGITARTWLPNKNL